MKRRFLILAAAVSSALFLSSCAVGPDYERPVVPVPENFRNIHGQVDASNWLTARWWRQYNDPGFGLPGIQSDREQPHSAADHGERGEGGRSGDRLPLESLPAALLQR